MNYSWKKFRDHYVVIDCITGAIIAHCDSPAECREEIAGLMNSALNQI